MALTRVTNDLQDSYNYPLICDDISGFLNGQTMTFTLKVNGLDINSVADSRNVQVELNGKIQRPYISERVMPWIMEYTPNGAYKIVGNTIIFYNPPAAGDVVSLVITKPGTYTQSMTNSYSPRPIVFGD